VLSNEAINGGIIGIGERPPNIGFAEEYFAQTFTTPATSSAVDRVGFYINNSTISPYMGYNVAGPVTLRVLLTSIVFDGTGFHPDQVLSESSPVVIPHKEVGSQPFWDFIDVDVPDVSLQPSAQYAFLLDAADDLNLQDDVHAFAQVASANGYNGGQFWDTRIPWDQNGGNIGTRQQNFAQTWNTFPASQNVDMAFRITFVPEPSAWLLGLLAATEGCFVASWNRRIVLFDLDRRDVYADFRQ